MTIFTNKFILIVERRFKLVLLLYNSTINQLFATLKP